MDLAQTIRMAGQLDRVVLLGLGAEVEQVVGAVVDAADEGARPVDDDDLAVHAAEYVDRFARTGVIARIEDADLDAGGGQPG